MAGSDTRFLFQALVYLIHAVFICLRPLICFISTCIFRLLGESSLSLNRNDKKINVIEAESGISPQQTAEKDVTECSRIDGDADEEEKPEVYLKFKFPTYEEFRQIQKETGTFVDEQQTKEINKGTYRFGICSINEEGHSHRNLEAAYTRTGGVHDNGEETPALDGVENGKSEGMGFTRKPEESAQTVKEEEEFLNENSVATTSFEHISSVVNPLPDSCSDDFLSDMDFGEEMEAKMETESELSSGFDTSQGFPEDFDDEESDIMEELNQQHADGYDSDFLSEEDFDNDLDNTSMNGGDHSGTLESEDSSTSDSGDANKLESLRPLKMGAAGLPTILEESESPKITDDLGPFKMDEFQRQDGIGELHKFYRSYRERMRKLDIMTYQKMYAIGCLKLKEPLQSMSKQNSSSPSFTSLVSQDLWPFRNKTHCTDPMKKFTNELQGDFEVAYVGQMCLSWEFLHWQYQKALDLWDSDPHGVRRYNEVGNEFQQFQVLMQRFVENERFQGPRMQNYVSSRCHLRNLLQVPVIREDNFKDKRKRSMYREEYVVTSEELVEIVEESIRIFWRFVQADKDCAAAAIHGHKKKPELLSPAELKLFMEAKRILQKKARKLKDLLRSENCILKKFRQCRDDDSDQVLCFFSQVDTKLVSRALNMSRITRDQLIWCHDKLNRISFVNGKIRVEPSFLLFPC